eukprot:jgi/Ulvmu1/779/UM010_0153.1
MRGGSDFVRPRVRQNGVEAEDARDGFFGDLAGADDALEIDVDAPPCEDIEGAANDAGGILEQLRLQEPAPQAQPRINVADLFGSSDANQAAPIHSIAQQVPALPGLYAQQPPPATPPGLQQMPQQPPGLQQMPQPPPPGLWSAPSPQHHQPAPPPGLAFPAASNAPFLAPAPASPQPPQPHMPIPSQAPLMSPAPQHSAAQRGLPIDPSALFAPAGSSPATPSARTAPPQPPPAAHSHLLPHSLPSAPPGFGPPPPGFKHTAPQQPLPRITPSAYFPWIRTHARHAGAPPRIPATPNATPSQTPRTPGPTPTPTRPQRPATLVAAPAATATATLPHPTSPPARPRSASAWRPTPAEPPAARLAQSPHRPTPPHSRPPPLHPPPPPDVRGTSAPPTPQSVTSSQRFPVMPPAGRLHAAPSGPPSEAPSAHSGGPGHLAQQGFGGRGSGDGDSRGRFPGHRMPVLPGLGAWVRDYACMGMREVDDFLLFNMRNLHSGELYADDFYFQAHINKHYGGTNAGVFRPRELFNLAPHERAAADPAAHAKVEGLGKFVYSSLRAPRQLLSVDSAVASSGAADGARTGRARGQENLLVHAESAATAGADAADDDDSEPEEEMLLQSSVRRQQPAEAAAERAEAATLNAAPKVAARKVIEDCDCQLLDVDDLDRMSAAEQASSAAPAGNTAGYREERRRLLMDGVADAFAAGAEGAARDGVFRYCLELPKGRRVVARVLRRMFGPAAGDSAQGGRVLHALLRNARCLFGDNVRPRATLGVVVPPEAHLVESTVAAALEAAAAVRRMRAAEDALTALEALAESDIVAEAATVRGVDGAADDAGLRGVLPLLLLNHEYRVDADTPWLGAVVIAVFEAAARLRLRDGGAAADVAAGDASAAAAGRFVAAFDAVFDRFVLHIEALGALVQKVAGGPQAEGAVESLRGLAAGDVLEAMNSVCSKAQEVRLATALTALVVI